MGCAIFLGGMAVGLEVCIASNLINWDGSRESGSKWLITGVDVYSTVQKCKEGGTRLRAKLSHE